MMTCVLCENPKPLCKSHIVPEFAYRGIYDERHRIISFEPTTPEKSSYLQKGLRDHLLCKDCEGFINDKFEKPFLKQWVDDNALGALEGKKAGTLTGIDYPAFKLFHLSVLFRAHHASIPNFAEVDIGSHASVIREMLLTQKAGRQWEYSIVCSAIKKPDGGTWTELVGPAHSIMVGAQQAFLFTFAGCQWFYYQSSILTPELDRLCLKESGELPVVKADWLAIAHYRAMAR